MKTKKSRDDLISKPVEIKEIISEKIFGIEL